MIALPGFYFEKWKLDPWLLCKTFLKNFFVKSDLKFVRINLNEVLYIEAMADYVVINLNDNKHNITEEVNGEVKEKLEQHRFLRNS